MTAGTLPTDSSFVNAAFFWVKRPSGKVFLFLDETMVKPSQTFVLLFGLSDSEDWEDSEDWALLPDTGFASFTVEEEEEDVSLLTRFVSSFDEVAFGQDRFKCPKLPHSKHFKVSVVPYTWYRKTG